MSNYTKATNFATKDALTTGNPLKTLSGTELDDEFNAIQVANNTKANASNAALTGVPVAPTAASGTSTTQVATTAFVTAVDSLKAPLASPTFTGVPAAPTAAADTSTTQLATTAFVTTEANLKADLAGAAFTGAVTTTSTFDGVDISARDAVLTSTTTTAGNAMPKAGGAFTGAVTTNSTFDGVDIATRDGVLTSTTTTAGNALPKSGGAMTGIISGFESTGIDDNATSTSITIDTAENVMIGTTYSAVQDTSNQTGHTLWTNGVAAHSASPDGVGTVGILNRQGSNGKLQEFRKDGVEIGSIDVLNGDDISIGATSAWQAGVLFGNNEIKPMTTGVISDNQVNLGDSASRFKDLYLSGSIVISGPTGTGTSTSNGLDAYDEGTFVPVIADAASGGNTGTGSGVGTYTRVGRLVYVTIFFNNAVTTGMTGTNDFYIRGLPFTSLNASQTATGSVNVRGGFSFTSGAYLTASLGGNQSSLRIAENVSNADFDYITVNQLTSGTADFFISMTYQAA